MNALQGMGYEVGAVKRNGLKRCLPAVAIFALCLAGVAEAGKESGFAPLHLYVGINGMHTKIPITADENQTGIIHEQEVAMYRRNWEAIKGCARVFQPVDLSEQWTKASFTFLPGASGKVMIKLGAKWFDPRDEKRLVYFDDIQVTGVTLQNPGFEEAEDGNIVGWEIGSRKTKSLAPADGGRDGGKCLKLCLYDFAFLYQNIEVEADKPVTVTFWCRVTPREE